MYIKYDAVSSIFFSCNINFLDFYSIFKLPKSLLLLDHKFTAEMNKYICRENDIPSLLTKRIEEWPDLYCMDSYCDTDLNKLSNDIIKKIDTPLTSEIDSFINYYIPEIGNNFTLYTHDDGYYSCFWTAETSIFKYILNRKILKDRGRVAEDESYLLLRKALEKGVYFDLQSININDNFSVSFSIYICDGKKDFSSSIIEARNSKDHTKYTLKYTSNDL